MEAASLRGCDELGALGTLVLAMKALGLGLVLLLAVTATSAQELTPTAPGAFRVSLDQDQHPVAGRIIGQVLVLIAALLSACWFVTQQVELHVPTSILDALPRL